jgi:hypothetical protein
LSVVRYRPLRWAYPPSRGVLPSVMCLKVWWDATITLYTYSEQGDEIRIRNKETWQKWLQET